jgi:hypothetical protein
VRAVDADAFLDLRGELARRGEDERPDRAARAGRAVSRGEQLKERQGEARGLTGAGLRRAEQVASGEDDRDRLGLDGGGAGIALFRDCAEQLGREPERVERGTDGKSPEIGLRRASLQNRFRQTG